MRMPELKALTRKRRLRGYSQLRKAELIAFLQDNEPQAQDDRDLLTQIDLLCHLCRAGPPRGTSTDVYLGTAEGITNQSQTTRVRRCSFN